MLKMNSKVNKDLFPKRLSGLFHKYQDTYLVDDSLSNPEVLLLCINLIDEINKKSRSKYENIKDLFISLGKKENNFNVAVTRAKQRKWIELKDNCFFIQIGGLKKIREILGQVGKAPVYIIKYGHHFQARKLFEEFLSEEIVYDEVLLCDSYVSHLTLFPFSVLKGIIKSIKILTSNVYDSAKMKAYKKEMEKELAISVEIKNNNKIHDRFIICGDKCWTIGSSIKDLGNKDATIKEISEVTSSMKNLFCERWNEASDI